MQDVTKMHRFSILLSLILVLLVPVYAQKSDCAKFNQSIALDEYLKSPVSSDSYAELDADKVSESLKELKGKNFSVIDKQIAQKWVPTLKPKKKKGRFYLVRGVRMVADDKLLLYANGGKILVFQGVLGSVKCVQTWDTALVVFSNVAIDSVIYSYSVAE